MLAESSALRLLNARGGPVEPLSPFAAVYVFDVMTHTGIPFIVEMRDASSGTALNMPK